MREKHLSPNNKSFCWGGWWDVYNIHWSNGLFLFSYGQGNIVNFTSCTGRCGLRRRLSSCCCWWRPALLHGASGWHCSWMHFPSWSRKRLVTVQNKEQYRTRLSAHHVWWPSCQIKQIPSTCIWSISMCLSKYFLNVAFVLALTHLPWQHVAAHYLLLWWGGSTTCLVNPL